MTPVHVGDLTRHEWPNTFNRAITAAVPGVQVDTMVAQSLDLPPSAARWRQHQRKQNDKQAARRASGHFPVASIPWASTNKPTGQAAEAASVTDIVAGAQVRLWDPARYILCGSHTALCFAT
jgi:hypothetical protein